MSPNTSHAGHAGLDGHPCHELYSRCFRNDADLLEYRVRQREHGARKEREQIAAFIRSQALYVAPSEVATILFALADRVAARGDA